MRTTEELARGVKDAEYLKEMLAGGLASARDTKDEIAEMSLVKAINGFNHLITSMQEILHVIAHVDQEAFEAGAKAAEACEEKGAKANTH